MLWLPRGLQTAPGSTSDHTAAPETENGLAGHLGSGAMAAVVRPHQLEEEGCQ